MAEDQETVTVETVYQTESSKAFCVREYERGPDIWLAKSLGVSIFPREPDRNDVVKVRAPLWLLKREGLV